MSPIWEHAVGAVAARAFALAAVSPRFRTHVFQPAIRAFTRHALATWRRSGPEGWARLHLPLIRAAGRGRAALVRERTAMDATRADHLARVHAFEDPLLGIAGHDGEGTRERAVRVETQCPLGELARAAQCPDFCRVLVHAFETETLVTLNPSYVLEPLTELLSAGDPRCTFVHRVGPAPADGGPPDGAP